jgi:putative lipoic acid-binding regulatory protein
MSDEETLLEFPCNFCIKVMGLSHPEFDLLVAEIVRKHAPDLGEGAVRTRPSKGGKYLAVSVTITATSKNQLDCIYQDLTDHEMVLMSL